MLARPVEGQEGRLRKREVDSLADDPGNSGMSPGKGKGKDKGKPHSKGKGKSKGQAKGGKAAGSL